MRQDEVIDEYFEWMCKLVCDKKHPKRSYKKLLMFLHNTEFTCLNPMDTNRAVDGICLRDRFAYKHYMNPNTVQAALNGSCSVFEMMVALAIRCEEHIMDDPDIGDRTYQWFWGMIKNIGLESMTSERFDKDFVHRKVMTFLHREYKPDGTGGLFRVPNCESDMRDIEIWYQMCWYLDSIL